MFKKALCVLFLIFVCNSFIMAAEIKIGLAYLDVQGFYAGVRQGVLDASTSHAKNTFSFIESNSSGDVSKELQFVNNAITARVSVLIMSAVSTNGSRKAFKNAKKAGIPIICYNTCLEDLDAYVYTYALGDPKRFGFLSGERLVNIKKEENIKKLAVGIVNCEMYEVCVQRKEGFECALQKTKTAYDIVANQEGTELDKAIDVAIQMVNANPSINILYGESGGATLGAVRAVRKLNKVGKIFVVGSDMTTDIAQELKKNDVLKGITDISGKAMGELAFRLALKAVNKQRLNDKIVPAEIKVYRSSLDAQEWLETHKDGLP